MNENAVRSSIQADQRSPEPDGAERVMQSLMAEVMEDALRAPTLYLRDTVVPAGGE